MKSLPQARADSYESSPTKFIQVTLYCPAPATNEWKKQIWQKTNLTSATMTIERKCHLEVCSVAYLFYRQSVKKTVLTRALVPVPYFRFYLNNFWQWHQLTHRNIQRNGTEINDRIFHSRLRIVFDMFWHGESLNDIHLTHLPYPYIHFHLRSVPKNVGFNYNKRDYL